MQIAIPNSTTALICGGTAPIGARIAIGLARAGCSRVVVCGRDRARGEATVEALRRENSGAAFAYVQADISAPGGADAMFAEAGPFDIYVHCVPPGGGAGGRIESADRSRFRANLSTALAGLADACAIASVKLRERGGGSIILFASDAGRAATPGHSLTGVVQGGIMSLTRSLALELSRDRIRVNCISPTYVLETPLLDRLMNTPAAKAVEKAAQRAGLGLPTPDDIAPLAVFLSSPLASKITGQIVSVNGGLSAN